MGEVGEMVGSAGRWGVLLYYCQAWHVVWEGRGLFSARIEAGGEGPVVGVGRQDLELSERERGVVDAVVGFYGGLTDGELASLVRSEAPWREAEVGAEIPVSALLRFYSGLALRHGEDVPRRPVGDEELAVPELLALVESEVPRWRETLDRLAQ
ncbi:Panacea domain-containing protein [Actinokineospora diospyrosa]|uniref:DUF4065 domain-containing protein n=1 Tax=Actinokineospora diospyrosa TaxID=103728 RepID=A0ABT1IJ66_9PSEU|nr:type II toxin-antitoxin system antitoxin SocA domain-containing protein [Actinokineospora diospyrosa]MCP2272251.1 Protein of unknown function (DUF4065) [Actinokineospora diospyrosa]